MLSYDELLNRTDAPAGSAWGLFGERDDIGTVNFLTPERVVAAARLVRRGAVFNLDLPLDAFQPPLSQHRGSVEHTIFQTNANHRDDRVDNFYLQGSTQIDGLRHFRHWEHGFYDGAADDEIAVGTSRLGVDRWADHGMVGRGVLLDIAAYYEAAGRTIDQMQPQPLSVTDLEATAAHQGVSFEHGDILLLRTGWLCAVLDQNEEERARLQAGLVCPGLENSKETLRWLWDQRFSVVAADNVALEAYPPPADSPFVSPDEAAGRDRMAHTGMMHRLLIPLLGLAIGELWNLEELASDCHEDGVWEFLLVAKPLNLVGGVGSPANAVAIK